MAEINNQTLIMKLQHHIAASIIISGLLHAVFKSWTITTASFVSGIFIDLDHIIDYVITHGRRFDAKHFFRYFNNSECKKAIFILHGWEWLFILAAAAKLTGWNPLLTGVLIGFAQHLMLDQIFNKTSLLAYFFFWRWKHEFNHKVCMNEKQK